MAIRKLKKLTSILSLFLYLQGAQAGGVLIDGFTDFETINNDTTAEKPISGTDLPNLLRTLTATETSDGETEVSVEKGFLHISNDYGSSGTASIFYSFDTFNLASVAEGFLFNIDFIDLEDEVQLEIIANATSVFSFVTLDVAEQYEIKFSQFTIPSVFNQLTSLQLNFKGVENWDGSFGSFVTNSKTVPEPSVIVLLIAGFIAMGKTVIRKNKQLT